jgi:Na+-translocating ferredoxin:NAD+ oxidoreductase RnfC subunit
MTTEQTAYRPRRTSEILATAEDSAVEASTEAQAEVADVEVKEVPDKYKGKDANDIIEMHQNAESRLGQLQNEVGNLRGLVTDLSALQRPTAEPEPAQEPVTITGDDLLTDPASAIRSILQPELDKLEAASNVSAANTIVQTESNSLMNDYDVDAITATPEFQAFATRTPSRTADLNTAAKGEGLDQVRAARRLLEDYQDFQGATSTDTKTVETPVEQARKVATEAATTGAPISGKAQIYESDVIALINSDPTKYRSPGFQSELMAAIKEGRFVKIA